jgi:hypothetical protein
MTLGEVEAVVGKGEFREAGITEAAPFSSSSMSTDILLVACSSAHSRAVEESRSRHTMTETSRARCAGRVKSCWDHCFAPRADSTDGVTLST